MRNGPLVSFLIPAFHSPIHLAECILSVTQLGTSELECVVGVSSNDSESFSVLDRFRGNNQVVTLDYGRSDAPMVYAYERLLSHAKGEWVSIIGQDDGALPWFFPELHLLLSKWPSVEAFSFRRAYFFWPGTESTYGSKTVDLEGRRWSKICATNKALLECLLGLGEHYELPQTYTNNLIKYSAIQNVKSLCGNRFYHEPIPDVYSGVALSLSVDSFVYSGMPMFWTGTSALAAGYRGHDVEEPLSFGQSDQLISAKSHSTRWKELGYDFHRYVGEKLWLGSNSTPLYVLSALHTYPPEAPLKKMRRWNQIAFSMGLAQILTGARSQGVRKTIELVKELALRAKGLGFSLPSLFLLGVWLFPIIQVLRFGRKIRRRLDICLPRRMFGPSVSLHSYDKISFPRISAVNQAIGTQLDADYWRT